MSPGVNNNRRGAAVDPVERLTERLDTYLHARDMTRESLLASLDEPFGRPLLVVAAGSIPQGVGNARSDLDVIIVVENKVSRMPLASFSHSVLIDPAYFSVSEAERWIPAIRDSPWPPVGGIGLDQWGRHCEQLLYATRFAYGVPLFARDGWDQWMMAFREPWLIEHLCQWWHVEAVRRRVAAGLLAGRKPMLAAQRQMDAVLAALERRAAAAGQCFFGPKWLAEKLRSIGDQEGLTAFRTIMRGPTTEPEARAAFERNEALLDRFGVGGDFVASLAYLSGVKTREHDGKTIVSHGTLRSVTLDQPVAAAGHNGPIWLGSIATPPPPAIETLFAADLLWLSIGARAE